MKVKSTLNKLAAEANRCHVQVLGALGSALLHAKHAGLALRKAKDHLKHGEWELWLKVNFRATPATARTYMRIAENWEIVEHEAKNVERLSINRALEILRVQEPTPKQTEFFRECRRQLLRAFAALLKEWDDKVVCCFASIGVDDLEFRELIRDRLDEIRIELVPLSRAIANAEWRRTNSFLNDELPFEQSTEEFNRAIATAFQDDDDLSPFQREILSPYLQERSAKPNASSRH